MDVAANDLAADVLYQLGALDAFASVAGTRGALRRSRTARCTTPPPTIPCRPGRWWPRSCAYDPTCRCSALPGSALAGAADAAGVPFVAEAFADRAYTAEGRLVPRIAPGRGASTTEATVVAQALSIARDGAVIAADGTAVGVRVASLCLHGDTPGAVAIARSVRAALVEIGVTLAPFVA